MLALCKTNFTEIMKVTTNNSVFSFLIILIVGTLQEAIQNIPTLFRVAFIAALFQSFYKLVSPVSVATQLSALVAKKQLLPHKGQGHCYGVISFLALIGTGSKSLIFHGVWLPY